MRLCICQKPQACTTQRVNPNIIYEQFNTGSSIVTCPTAMQDVNNRGDGEQREIGYMGTLYFVLNFSVNLKVL